MIKEHKMYSVSCDRCKTNAFESDENIAWESAGSAWEMAYASGWQEIRGKHYCPGCYEINEEDQLVVKGGVRMYFESTPKGNPIKKAYSYLPDDRATGHS